MLISYLSPYKILKRFRFLPLVFKHVQNWYGFMYNYAFAKSDIIYRFRNGAKLKIVAAFDHVPIIEVMMKKDYGKIPNNATIIDIGASTGVFSIYAISSASNLKIYSYEPSYLYFETLKENIRLNHAESSVFYFNAAIAGETGTRNLVLRSSQFIYPSFISTGNENNSQNIKTYSLKDIIEEHKLTKVDILKMDCEGAEYEIFENCTSNTLSIISEIRMEYHNIDIINNVEKLKKILSEKGFQVSYYQPTNEVFGNIWFCKK